jgi:hypothetical protein
MRKNVRETGKLNFTGEVVWRGSESKLNAAEKRTVRQRKTFIDWGWGYNLTTGGDHFKLSKRSIRKIRKTLIQYYKDCPERCLEIGVQSSRRMADPVVIRNLSKSALRQWADSAARQAMSKKKLAQYRKDPTIRAKVSAAAKLQWASPTARAEKSKVSKQGWKRRTGKRRLASARAKRNMTKAQLERFADPAECKKISDGQLRRYKNPVAHIVSSTAQYKRFRERPMSAETNAKISKKTKWNWAHNPVFRARMFEVARSRGHTSKATKAKMSISGKKAWATRRKAAV